MSVCLCVSCFRSSASLRAHSDLGTRNAEYNIGQEYMAACLCVSFFVTSASLHAHNAASLQEMYSVGWGRCVYGCVCVFQDLEVLHLSVHILASLEEIYSVEMQSPSCKSLFNCSKKEEFTIMLVIPCISTFLVGKDVPIMCVTT